MVDYLGVCVCACACVCVRACAITVHCTVGSCQVCVCGGWGGAGYMHTYVCMCDVYCTCSKHTLLCANPTDIKQARPHGQIYYQQQLSISDEVSVYLELCEAYCQLNRLIEAKELMEEAAKKFEATSQGMRCAVCVLLQYLIFCLGYQLQMLIWL